MPDETLRRRMLWHGWLNLIFGLLLGFPIAAGWHPQAWATIHIPQISTGIMICVAGLLWRDLRLTPAQQRRTVRLTLGANYVGLVVGIFNGIVDMPGPVSQPDAPPPPDWILYTPVLPGMIALAMLFGSVAIIMKGLGGPPMSQGSSE